MKRKQIFTNCKKIAVLSIFLLIALTFFLIIIAKKEEITTSLAVKYYSESFQCVVYVQCYYQKMFDIEIKNIGSAQRLFEKAENFNLYAHKNGGFIYPQPGDILVFGHRNRVGHVSIITDVSEDGVKIIEQNWQGSAITTNNNQPLRMSVSGGKFSIENRDSFWVIGWVSRTNKNPNNFFLFPQGDSEGWYPDHHIFVEEENLEGLRAKTIGRSPLLGSPVFIAGNSINNPKKINIRAKIENNSGQKGTGRLLLRDKNGNWENNVPFTIEVNNDFQVYSVDLTELADDFKITQIKLQLNDNPQVMKEFWTINWIQIY